MLLKLMFCFHFVHSSSQNFVLKLILHKFPPTLIRVIKMTKRESIECTVAFLDMEFLWKLNQVFSPIFWFRISQRKWWNGNCKCYIAMDIYDWIVPFIHLSLYIKYILACMYYRAKIYKVLNSMVILICRCVNMIYWEILFWFPSFTEIGLKKIKITVLILSIY
jgi:hypothetical protein